VQKDVYEKYINPTNLKTAHQKAQAKSSLSSMEETFDLTGKSNPQYRRYQDWGKFLKNKYGGKEITDAQGNTWIEIDLKPDYKTLPIQAFGFSKIGTAVGIGVGTASALGLPLVSSLLNSRNQKDFYNGLKYQIENAKSHDDLNSISGKIAKLLQDENQRAELMGLVAERYNEIDY